MDFGFSEIERDFAESLRRYARERLRPEYSKWDRGAPYPRERLRELATLGIPGLRVPAAYGGAEATYVMGGIAAEELARGDYNITLFVQLSMIAADLISGFATAPCKERWLRGLARGDEIVAFGLTEPGAGSDAAALATTATRDGDSYVVTGEKASITFAGMAEREASARSSCLWMRSACRAASTDPSGSGFRSEARSRSSPCAYRSRTGSATRAAASSRP